MGTQDYGLKVEVVGLRVQGGRFVDEHVSQRTHLVVEVNFALLALGVVGVQRALKLPKVKLVGVLDVRQAGEWRAEHTYGYSVTQ